MFSKALLSALFVTAIALPAAASDDVDHDFSLTFSPLHLIGQPFFEATGEFRISDKIGVAVIAGGGAYSSIPMLEAGGQFVFYPVGTFDHGMQLGVEAAYIAGLSDQVGERSFVVAQGFAGGPFVGYKLALDVGFTFQIQAGAQAIVATGGDVQAVLFAPLVNANLGWSF